MDKLGVVIIALAIIVGAVILGGAIIIASFFSGSSGIVVGDDTVDPGSVDYMSAYLEPINGSEVKDYQASCMELDNSTISTTSVGNKVKFQGKIISILENSSGTASFLVQVPGISKYPFLAVTYGSTMLFKIGDTIYIYGEYSDLAAIPDPNSGKNEMVPLVRSVYLQKS
jgi:hypothetical protein